jgi:hypothetical protein
VINIGSIGKPYDVERDIERARADREKREQTGTEQTPDDMRRAGGVPITDRAAVLLDHLIRSHLEAAAAPGLREGQALTCARRVVEYVGRLEHAVLDPLSTNPEDTPRELLGLAAATFEQLAALYESSPDESVRTGAETFRILAPRFRVMETRIGDLPGQARQEVQLPIVQPEVES